MYDLWRDRSTWGLWIIGRGFGMYAIVYCTTKAESSKYRSRNVFKLAGKLRNRKLVMPPFLYLFIGTPSIYIAAK